MGVQIRLSREEDIDHLIEIWLEGSVQAHHFIDQEYWKSMKDEMKHKYLPMSVTYVVEQGERVVGFVSMVEDYLAALFIDPNFQKNGFGKSLLDYVKRKHDTVELKVYRKNAIALHFYVKNGFVIKETVRDEQTSEEEFVLSWQK